MELDAYIWTADSLTALHLSAAICLTSRGTTAPHYKSMTRVWQRATAGTNLAVAGGALSLRTFLTAQQFDQTFSSIAVDRNSESLVRAQAVPAQQFGFSAVWNRQLGQRNTFALGIDFRRVTGHSAETLFTRGAPTGTVDSGGRQRYFGAFLEDSCA